VPRNPLRVIERSAIVSHYRMGESGDSATTVFDQIGPNHLTMVNSPIYGDRCREGGRPLYTLLLMVAHPVTISSSMLPVQLPPSPCRLPKKVMSIGRMARDTFTDFPA